MNILKTSMAAVIIACSTLAGCSGTSTSTTDATIIADIQAASVALCAVEPTAASIAALVAAAANPAAGATVAIVTTIAGKVCSAVGQQAPSSVSKVGGSFVPAPVVVDGVTIQFEPVKK